MFKRIDHIVIAVKSISETLPLYRDTYGLPVTPVQDVPALGIKSVRINVPNGFIELAEPLDPNGAVGKFLAERGDGLYMIAIQVDDMPGTVKRLQEKGARLLGAENASKKGGRVFIHPKSTHGALIMLMD